MAPESPPETGLFWEASCLISLTASCAILALSSSALEVVSPDCLLWLWNSDARTLTLRIRAFSVCLSLTVMTDSIVPVNSARTVLSASSPMAMAILIACLNQLFSFSCFNSFSQLSVGPPSLNSRMTGAYAPVWLFKYSLRESFLSSSLQAAPKSVTPPAFRSFQITSPIAIGPLCGVIHEQPLLNCMMATLISASSFAALISGKSLVMASSIALLTLPILLPHILPEVSTT